MVINTELRNKNLIDGYKNISKETDKLIQQFNKKVDQIKKEEIEVDNLKAKYNQLMSGSKAPTSLTAMESQLKKCEKECTNLEKQYNDVINKMAMNQTDLEFAKGTGDIKQISLLNGQKAQLDNQSIFLATQLEDARDKAEKLKQSLNELKMNPQSSMEVQNLKAKIDLAEQSLNNSKQEANDLVSKIKKANTINYDSLTNSVNKLGSSILSHITGKNGLSGGLDKISSKIDKFKSKITRLISTAMIFSLLRKGLTNLSSGFTSLLSSNDNFSKSLNQIKVNLMTAFAPIYNFVLPAINALMSALSKITGTIASFTASLFGQTADQAKKNAKALYGQAKAQKSVNEEQENLASFDKLEANQDNDTKGTSGKELDFSTTPKVNKKLLDYLNELKELICDGKWYEAGAKLADSLNKALANLKVKDFFEKGKQIAINIIEGINGFINTFDFGLLAQKFSELIKGMWDIILTALVLFDWQGLGKAIGDFILGIDWWGVLVQLLSIISALLDAIIDLVIGLGTSIIEHIISWLPIVWEVIKSIPGWINDNVLQPIWGLFKNICESILLSFSALWEGIKIGASSAWEGIKSVFSGLSSFFGNIFSKAWEKVKAVFSTGGKIFDGIKEGIVSAFKNIVNAIIKGINKVVSIPFNGINNALNRIKGINILGAKPFDWISTINVPQIPMLAEGAVIPPNKKFTAVLGDQRNGNNLEGPESLFRKIVREESGDKQVILNATFIMQCETEEIGRAALKGIHLLENIDGQEYILN